MVLLPVIVTVAALRRRVANRATTTMFSSTTIRSRSPLNFTIAPWILSKDLRALFQHGQHKFPLSDGLVSGLDAVIVRVKFLRHLVRPELVGNGSRGCIYIHLSYTFISFA